MAIGDKKPVVMEFDRGVPGGVATLDENGKLAESQRVVKSNRNLIINWHLANPVNRNGKTEYTANGRTFDRWTLAGGGQGVATIDFSEGAVILSSSSGYSGLINLIDIQVPVDLVVTLSALYKGAIALHRYGETYKESRIVRSEHWDVASITYTIPAGTDFSQSVAYSPSFYTSKVDNEKGYVKAIKLEIGSVQTLAHQDENGNWVLNEIPNYAEQYAICEQYSPITGEFVGSQHSNPNLLDNSRWDKKEDIINQRGQTEYANTGYTIDRWSIASSVRPSEETWKLFVDENGISADHSPLYIRQSLENKTKYCGKVLTFSILFKNKGLLFASAKMAETYKFRFVFISSNGVYYSTTPTTTNEMVVIELPTDDYIIAAKLELGPVQTLAHKEGDEWILNDPPPNKALELAKCQRYQISLEDHNITKGAHIIGSGIARTSTIAGIMIPLPAALRGHITISFNEYYSIYYLDESKSFPLKKISNIRYSPNMLFFNAEVEGNLTVGKDVTLLSSQTNGEGQFIIDANL